MTLLQAAQLSAFAVMLSAGQILFKRAADTEQPLRQIGDVIGLAGNFYMWAAFAIYGAATLFWIYLVQQVPLTRAYPFAALSFVIVPCFAWCVLGEAISPRYVLGIVLIGAGICLSAYN
jgi:drug/metabolite transporter (DMT)-like permease